MHTPHFKQSTRYPYTIADDYVREFPTFTNDGCKLSRSEASAILEGIAKALNMPHQQLAEKIADYAENRTEQEKSAYVEKICNHMSNRFTAKES